MAELTSSIIITKHMHWVLHLNLVIDRFKCYNACVCDYNWAIILIFFCFRATTQQSILHLVVSWEVFTINWWSSPYFMLQCWKAFISPDKS